MDFLCRLETKDVGIFSIKTSNKSSILLFSLSIILEKSIHLAMGYKRSKDINITYVTIYIYIYIYIYINKNFIFFFMPFIFVLSFVCRTSTACFPFFILKKICVHFSSPFYYFFLWHQFFFLLLTNTLTYIHYLLSYMYTDCIHILYIVIQFLCKYKCMYLSICSVT